MTSVTMTKFCQRSQYLFRQTTTGNHYPETTTDSIQDPDVVKIKVPRVLVERRRLSAGKCAGDCGRSRRKAPQ